MDKGKKVFSKKEIGEMEGMTLQPSTVQYVWTLVQNRAER